MSSPNEYENGESDESSEMEMEMEVKKRSNGEIKFAPFNSPGRPGSTKFDFRAKTVKS